MPKLDIRNLYYITHMDNLSSILKRGITKESKMNVCNLRAFITQISSTEGKKKTRLVEKVYGVMLTAILTSEIHNFLSHGFIQIGKEQS